MNNPQRELVDGVLELACRPASNTGRFPSLVGNAVIEDDPLWRGYRSRLDIEPTTRGMTMSRGPKPKVWYDGEIYSCRSYNVEVPDLDTMPRMGALVWLLQNTTKRGYARKAPPPYFGGLTMVVR